MSCNDKLLTPSAFDPEFTHVVDMDSSNLDITVTPHEHAGLSDIVKEAKLFDGAAVGPRKPAYGELNGELHTYKVTERDADGEPVGQCTGCDLSTEVNPKTKKNFLDSEITKKVCESYGQAPPQGLQAQHSAPHLPL